MGKKKVIFLIVFFMAVSILVPRLDVSAATSDLQILFNNNGNTVTSNNTINANFKVVNNGPSSINLADLKFRYFYTADSDKAQNFFCDHAGMMNGWSYTGVTDKVTGTFCKMSSITSNADTYFEVGFKSDAGILSAGGYIEIQTRVARNDWTNYDLSNDYSFKTLSTYGENNKIFVYLGRDLIYGDGGTIKTPTIMPTLATHDKYVNSGLSVTLTPNGSLFKGIVGLTQGKDYEVAGNIVTLKKEYINSLAIGIAELTFDFGVANNPKLTLAVKDTTPKPPYDAIIGTATGMPGDTVTVPVSFKNVAKAGNVGTGNFVIGYDNTLLEAVSVAPGSIVTNPVNNFSSKIDSNKGLISLVFLDNTIGDELIKTDGDFALITFKIKTTATVTTTPLEFKPLEFDCGANTTNGSITIINPESAQTISPTSVVFDKYIPSDIVVTIISNGNTFKGINGLTPGIDYTISGNKVIIAKSYLNNLPTGTKTLTFDFGLVKNPTLVITIMGTYDYPLNVTIGDVTGVVGKTINVPIKLTGVKLSGNVGTFNFYIKYDKAYLSAEAVTAGDIIVNPDVNFSAKINADKGIISFVFLDNTIGDELITSNGVLANIKFKTLATGSTPLLFDGSFVFGDGSMNKITYAKQTPGKINIIVGELEPEINPSAVSVKTNIATDISVTLTPYGHTFAGITGLTKGVDYTVSGNVVTILKSYLNTLQPGTKELTFDFGVSDNPVLKITVDMECACSTSVIIGTAKGALGDTVTVPITISDVRWAGGVGTFNFYVGYDNALLEALSVEPGNIIINPKVNFSSKIDSKNGTISVVFLDNTIGDELITSDGVLLNIAFKILGTKATITPVVLKNGRAFGDGQFAKMVNMYFRDGSVTIDKTNTLDLSIGKATGKVGETVAVPISFSNAANMGNVKSCDFKVSYDTNLLEAVSVEPGSIVTNAGDNFRANISTTSGAISLFFNSTEESQSISEDGVFANINFKLKTPTATQIITPVDINKIGAFSDLNLKQIQVTGINGNVTITRTTITESKINPSMESFVLGSTYGLNITLSPNGNTFKGISNLISGTDYIVSGNTVMILNEYMNSLKVGTQKLTFDFGIGDKNPVLEIEVKAGKPTMTINYIEVINNDPKDIYVSINSNGNPFNGIVGLKEGTDYTVSGNTVTILKEYVAKLPVETVNLTFDFGMTVNPLLKISKIVLEEYPLNVKIGTVTGAQGDIVTVPITLSNVKDVKNVGTFNFYVDFDKTLLKVVSVEPGAIITNPDINFSGKVNSSGIISVVFLDNTIGDEIIKNDGIVANISFELLGTSGTTVPIVFKEGGAFGNENMEKIRNVSYTGGKVTIDNTTKLNLSIGEVTGKEGEIVTVPINFANVAKLGNVLCCDFSVGYDANLLEAVSVESGSIVTNAIDNFKTLIHTTDGAINFLFISSGGDTIDKDGVFANLKFKLKNPNTSIITTPVTIKKIGAFGDSSYNRMPVLQTDGSVTIIRTTIPELINPSKKSIVLGDTDDLEITLNENTFLRIYKLSESTDYTVSENTVTIAKSYLDSLPVGIKKVTFDFGYGDENPVLELEVKAGIPTVTPNHKKVDKHVPANLVINIAPNGNPFKGIVGLTEDTDYTVSKNAVIILKSYLSTLKLGYKELTFDFGMTDNPYVTLGVIDSTPVETGLDVSIGTAAGKSGDTVTVPIYYKDVANSGNVRTSVFFIGYDNNLLDAVSVDPGAIVPATTTSNIGQIMGNGMISLNSYDGQLITEDGVFANITFKLKTPIAKKVTTPINFALDAAFVFYDEHMNEIEPVSRKAGSVTIDNSAVSVEKAIYPTFAKFDTYLPNDVVVTILPNADTFKGITGLVNGTDYTVSGNTVTILKSYLSNLNYGIKTFTFDLGLTDNPVLTINFYDTKHYSYQELYLTAGKVTGEASDIVKVPVNLSRVFQYWRISYAEFCMKYDTDLLEPISVEAGNIINNANANFSSVINPLNGTISFAFFDNTLGNEPITGDGAFAYVNFRLKNQITTPVTTPLTFKNEMYFGEGDFKQIKPIIVFGDITIKAKTITDPKIDVTNIIFDKNYPEDLKVNLIPNGNTFKGITGLIEGTDFTVLGNNVTILKSYISSLECGTTTFTIDFGVTKNPVLNVKIMDSSVEPTLYVRAGVATAARAGQRATIPISFADVANVGNIGTFNFYIGYDATKLKAVSVTAGDIVTNPAVNFSGKIDNTKGMISFVFLDNTIGEELIKQDGVFANIEFERISYDYSTNSPIKFYAGGAFGDGDFSKIENVITKDGSVNTY